MAPLDLVGSDERNFFDNLFRTRGDLRLAASQRGIGKRKVAGDRGSVTIVL